MPFDFFNSSEAGVGSMPRWGDPTQISPTPQYTSTVSPTGKKRAKLKSFPKSQENSLPMGQTTHYPSGGSEEHARAVNVPGQQGIPDIYEAYGIGGENGIGATIIGGLHDFLRTFVPGAIGGSQYGFQALSEVEAQKEREKSDLAAQQQKLMESPEMVGAYESARGMFPQGGAGFKDYLHQQLGEQMKMKSAQGIYGSSLEGLIGNPTIPPEIKRQMLQSAIALRSIPQTTYTMGAPTGLAGIAERALQGLGVNLPREPSVTYRTTGAPPEMGPSPKTSQKPKTGKKPEGFKWR